MLSLCTGCHRHVRSTPCPFCGTSQTTGVLARPEGSSRLSRAQLVASAVLAGSVAVSACGTDDSGVAFYGAPPYDEPDASTSTSSSGAIYGAPPRDSGASSSGSATSSSGSVYGGPILDDAGDDAATSDDAGADAAGNDAAGDDAGI